MAEPRSELEHLRALSKGVFGQAEQLGIMLWIARRDEERFTLTDVVDGMGYRYASSAQAPLKALTENDFIKRDESERGTRYRYYRRVDSLIWGFAEELAARVVPPAATGDASIHLIEDARRKAR